jgi:Flp pilus assembly protein TadG
MSPHASLKRRFIKDESGSIAITFGLLAIVIMLAMGAAVDIGRWQHARTRTLAAIDAAVLAGGRAFQVDADVTKALQIAANVYADNINTRSPVLSDTVKFVSAKNNTEFTASGKAVIAMSFLRMAGINELNLVNTSGSEFAKAVLPGGSLNANTHLEVSVMLDITGSMSGDKIKAMKLAAKDLVDIVIWADQSTYTSRVALVPFSSHVNVAGYAAAVRGTPVDGTASTSTYNNAVYKKYDPGGKDSNDLSITTCVTERTGTEAYTDAPPSTALVGRAYGQCAPSSTSTIIPLTNNKTALKTAIDGYAASGSTAGHLGTAWAWYMISPKWAYLWPTANQPKAYEAADVKKIVILMTDGEYNTEYCRGVETDSAKCSPPNGTSDSQARKLCTEMRKQKMVLYSIGFQIDTAQATTTLQDYCASEKDNYYKATTAKQLQEAFRDIALSISSLRLTH